MKEPVNKTDRRRHKRYMVGENVFAVVKKKEMILCKVVDVSKGGVLFFSDNLHTIKDNTINVDIYINDSIYIQDAPVTIVSDYTTHDEKVFDGFPIRYLRLTFDKLDKLQVERLMGVLEHNDPDLKLK